MLIVQVLEAAVMGFPRARMVMGCRTGNAALNFRQTQPQGVTKNAAVNLQKAMTKLTKKIKRMVPQELMVGGDVGKAALNLGQTPQLN